MKTGLIIILSLIIASCGKKSESTVQGGTSNLNQSRSSTDMMNMGDDHAFFYGANGASIEKYAEDDFLLTSGAGVNGPKGELNQTQKLGGRSFLGYSNFSSTSLPLNAQSQISFFNVRSEGSIDSLELNLVIDGNCNGIFDSDADAVVGVKIIPNTYFSMSSNTVIESVTQGKMKGVAKGYPFSTLYGKCLINTELFDLNMPRNKKLAGILIVVGDGDKNSFSDVTFRIFDINISI